MTKLEVKIMSSMMEIDYDTKVLHDRIGRTSDVLSPQNLIDGVELMVLEYKRSLLLKLSNEF